MAGGCNRRFTRGMLSFSDPMAMPNRLPNIGIPIQQKLLNACSLLDSANNTKLYILYVSDNAKNDAVFMNMIYTITATIDIYQMSGCYEVLFDSTRSLMVVRRRGILAALLDAAIVAALLAPETDATAAEAAFQALPA